MHKYDFVFFQRDRNKVATGTIVKGIMAQTSCEAIKKGLEIAKMRGLNDPFIRDFKRYGALDALQAGPGSCASVQGA